MTSGDDVDVIADDAVTITSGTGGMRLQSTGQLAASFYGAVQLSSTTGPMSLSTGAGGASLVSLGAVLVDADGSGTGGLEVRAGASGVDVDAVGDVSVTSDASVSMTSAASTTVTSGSTLDVSSVGAATVMSGSTLDVTMATDATLSAGGAVSMTSMGKTTVTSIICFTVTSKRTNNQTGWTYAFWSGSKETPACVRASRRYTPNVMYTFRCLLALFVVHGDVPVPT